MSNKNKNKAKKSGTSTLTLVQEILAVIGGIVGSVMAIYGFIKTFRDDENGLSWLLVLGGLIWLITLWNMFQKQRVYAYIYLAVTIIGGVSGWAGWQGQVQGREDKVIVLIAKFDGPEDEYGLRDEMIEQLRESTKGYEDTEIIAAEEMVTAAQGSAYARELGENYQADLVIWAWYKPTEDPNITIHLENLSFGDIFILNESETYQPEATLVDLETFEIQRQLGSETSTLITFISGAIQFNSGETNVAISRIEKLLGANDLSTYINPRDITFMLGYMHSSIGEMDRALYYLGDTIKLDPSYSPPYNLRGLIYLAMGNYENALSDFNSAIQLDPNSAAAFHNRGIVNHRLRLLDDALHDYTQSILIYPNNPEPYNGRAMIFILLENYDSAFLDLETALAIQPQYADAYGNRGVAYYELEQYEKAMDDFNKALQIDPKNANVYYNRGNIHQFVQSKIDLAIKDYSSAIEYGTSIKSVYVHRCTAYFKMGEYELALQDCDKAIELMPDLAIAYDNRGMVFEKMGRKTEAEADFAKYNQLIGQDAP